MGFNSMTQELRDRARKGMSNFFKGGCENYISLELNGITSFQDLQFNKSEKQRRGLRREKKVMKRVRRFPLEECGEKSLGYHSLKRRRTLLYLNLGFELRS